MISFILTDDRNSNRMERVLDEKRKSTANLCGDVQEDGFTEDNRPAYVAATFKLDSLDPTLKVCRFD